MTATTDLRAALREAANALARIGLRRDADLIASLRAIADAPPTVAELLPMVDATHEAWWTAFDDGETDCRARIGRDDGGNDIVTFEWRFNGGEWEECQLYSADRDQPARLVEVSP